MCAAEVVKDGQVFEVQGDKTYPGKYNGVDVLITDNGKEGAIREEYYPDHPPSPPNINKPGIFAILPGESITLDDGALVTANDKDISETP